MLEEVNKVVQIEIRPPKGHLPDWAIMGKTVRIYLSIGETVMLHVDPAPNQLTNGNLEDYQAKVSNVFTRLSEDTDKLTTEGVANSLRTSRDGISGSVVGVTDGDTIKVLDPSHVLHEVRLTGIDAPKRGQPFGKASTEYLTSLLAGKEVFVESSRSGRHGLVVSILC